MLATIEPTLRYLITWTHEADVVTAFITGTVATNTILTLQRASLCPHVVPGHIPVTWAFLAVTVVLASLWFTPLHTWYLALALAGLNACVSTVIDRPLH